MNRDHSCNSWLLLVECSGLPQSYLNGPTQPSIQRTSQQVVFLISIIAQSHKASMYCMGE